jgi:hypothetical protein
MTKLSGLDLDISNRETTSMVKTFGYNYTAGVSLIDEHSSPFYYTYYTVLTLWLDKNIAPFKEEQWLVENSFLPTYIEIHFKEKSHLLHFLMVWK